MASPYEWRIDAIEQNAKRACDSLWKLDSLGSDVGRLESALRDSRAETDGLRSALESAVGRIEQLERIVEELSLANNPGQTAGPNQQPTA